MKNKKVTIAVIVIIILMIVGIVILSHNLMKRDNSFDRDDPLTFFDTKKLNLLSLKEVEKIKVGMEFQEVVDLIGKLQRDVGSGALICEFDLSNGQTLRTIWEHDIIGDEHEINYDYWFLRKYYVCDKDEPL